MNGQEIAVIGMAGRFPGARTTDEFWDNLSRGVESIRVLSAEELRANGVSETELADPAYVRAAAILNDVDRFDAGFFGFSARDAAIMDPQHRHFLECAWEALENSGHTAESFPGSIGVYAGSGMNAYLIHNLLANQPLVQSAGLFLLRQTGNDKDVLSTRVSYQLNLHGPSLNIQTACSTSLVAIHMACQSLLNHECDMALAGGVTIELPHGQGYRYREGEILSQDGHCRSFDARSTGTVFGSGLGIVVLRRLEDAIADRDKIRAVILGSAINNDGSRKVGYLAPSVEGQAEAIAEALAVAGVDARSIGYVETHGTGTKVGDPIEISALSKAFHASTADKQFCAIGSVKSNLGHLDTAAGVAGFLKTVLALEHGQIPPSLHFEKPNPHIDFAGSPFYVSTRLQPWPQTGLPRRAGVTSLGIGGTNAHVILEAAPPMELVRNHRPWQLLTLSARFASALDALTATFKDHLEKHPELNLADVSFTCQVGRRAFKHRRAVVCSTAQDAIEALREPNSQLANTAEAASHDREVAFLFSGQGSQYVNMGLELYQQEPLFRDVIDQCAKILLPHLGFDLRTVLYPSAAPVEESRQINQTGVAQPALFCVEYALAKLWMSWGIAPKAMAGHSIGEYAAACLAGVFSLDAALAIVAARGRLMQNLPGGAMIAVPMSEQQLLPLLGSDVSLAAVNGPQQCVASGTFAAVEKFEQELAKSQIACRRLHTSHAFHSPMIAPMIREFTDIVRGFQLSSPRIPYLSNVTGTWITAAEATDPEYWAKHALGTVRFSDSLEQLFQQPDRTLLEVGPGQVLSALARQHPRKPETLKVLPSMRHPNEQSSDLRSLLLALGKLWASGAPVDWDKFRERDRGYRTPLPTYPFERQRYWIEPSAEKPVAAAPPLRQRDGIAEWFYRPVWKQSPRRQSDTATNQHWLIFADNRLAPIVAERLETAGHRVTIVVAGNRFHAADTRYTIRSQQREDYDTLCADLLAREKSPLKILHLWSLDAPGGLEHLEDAQNASFYSLLFLAQALGTHNLSGLQIGVVSDRMQRVGDEVSLHPETATLLGPCKVIHKEYPGIDCCSIDVFLGSGDHSPAAQHIIDEMSSADPGGTLVAYRDHVRWVQSFEHVSPESYPDHPKLREHGVYLITGGVGGIGLRIATRLATQVRAKLILTGRAPFPPRLEWESWLSNHASEPLSRKIRTILDIEQSGAEVEIVRADSANLEEMRAAIAQGEKRFGAIRGVIHAAGVLDDGPIQLKSRERAEAVLEAKLKGTLVLDELLKPAKLDFFLLFSSISSISAPAGQVDYVAANAFLDAFARSRATDSGTPVLALNSARWRETGMGDRGQLQQKPLRHQHPMLESFGVETSGAAVFSGKLSCQADWIVSDHRIIDGPALFPGTGYIEMASAALTSGDKNRPLELRDVFFSAPFTFEPDENRDVRVRLEPKKNQLRRFSITSKVAKNGEWQEYASGVAVDAEPERPPRVPLRDIMARCRTREISFESRRTKQETYFHFGPRWRNLQRIHVGRNEAVSEMVLPAEFRTDLNSFRIHPALLDLATGSALYLIRDYETSEDMYLPLGYSSVKIWGQLPDRIYSHIRVTGENSGRREVSTFDIAVVDPSGTPLLEIQGFSMHRARDKRLETLDDAARIASPQPDGGISHLQGEEALLKIFTKGLNAPEIVVSPIDPNLLARPVNDRQAAARNTQSASQTASQETAAALGEIEQFLAACWSELLGADHPKLEDDFFELGGHSLIAVQLFAKIRKAYGVSFETSLLFEARTIAKLAEAIRKELRPKASQTEEAPKRSSSLVAVHPEGSLPPLYLVSGAGGHVLIFQTLSNHLGPDQPVYALQPPGLDGSAPTLARVQDIAKHYLNEIKTVQPSGPYYLAGYSFGGVVTFEMAQQLRTAGEEVGLLALLDTEWRYWEQGGGPRPGDDESLPDLQKRYARRFRKFLKQPGYMIKFLLSMAWTRSIWAGQRGLRRLFGAFGRPVPRALGSIEDIAWFAVSTYELQPYPGPVTLFHCDERSQKDRAEDLAGWRSVVPEIEVRATPGNHLTFVKEPHVRQLAETLRSCISRTLVRQD